MTVEFTMQAEPRAGRGKRVNRRLRREGRVPGIVYGAGKGPTPISLDHDMLLHNLEHEAFYSHILTVNVGNDSQSAILRALQRHPNRPEIVHIDFQRVKADQPIRMQVPLHLLGDEECPGVKDQEGIVSRLMSEIEVECLPKNLPENIELDVSHLELNDAIHLSEIRLPEGVEIVALSHGEDSDQAVVTVYMPKVVEEPADEMEAAEAAAGESAEQAEEGSAGETGDGSVETGEGSAG